MNGHSNTKCDSKNLEDNGNGGYASDPFDVRIGRKHDLDKRKSKTALPPILLYNTWIELFSWNTFMDSKVWQGVFAGYSLWWLVHFIDVGFLGRWSFEANKE